MLVLIRFRVPLHEADAFHAGLEEAHEVLAQQVGYVGGHVGRNVDDAELWVLQTLWQGPGAYRRALSAYDVKVRAWSLLGGALEEPSAYELVEPGGPSPVGRTRADAVRVSTRRQPAGDQTREPL